MKAPGGRAGKGGRFALGFLVVTVLIVCIGGLASSQSSGFAQLDGSDVEPDRVLLHVTLSDDGDAIWRVEYRVALDDENTTEAFESLQTDIQDDPAPFVDRFRDRMTRTVSAAENTTGRSMAVTNVSVSTARTGLPEEYGIVQYTFEWEGFAVASGGELRVGDAIYGLFFDEGTSLRIRWPPEYELRDVIPPPDEETNESVIWRGPVDFGDSEPQLIVSTAPSSPQDTSTPGESNLLLYAGIIIGLGVLVGLGWVVFTRYHDRDTRVEGRSSELLSNEEQVLALLEERGGRMRQQEIVEALEWTDAKTSQVVKQLREDGEVEGFRLGRENVLRLPEYEENNN